MTGHINLTSTKIVSVNDTKSNVSTSFSRSQKICSPQPSYAMIGGVGDKESQQVDKNVGVNSAHAFHDGRRTKTDYGHYYPIYLQ